MVNSLSHAQYKYVYHSISINWRNDKFIQIIHIYSLFYRAIFRDCKIATKAAYVELIIKKLIKSNAKNRDIQILYYGY